MERTYSVEHVRNKSQKPSGLGVEARIFNEPSEEFFSFHFKSEDGSKFSV